jgi:hypothetical protein
MAGNMRTIRYEDYVQWEKEINATEDAKFKESLTESRAKEAEQPIATFYDGLNFTVRRSMDTHNSGERNQRVFENRPAIVGDDMADFSLTGVLYERRPELVRNFDDEAI